MIVRWELASATVKVRVGKGATRASQTATEDCKGIYEERQMTHGYAQLAYEPFRRSFGAKKDDGGLTLRLCRAARHVSSNRKILGP